MYLPILKLMGRNTANEEYFKDDLKWKKKCKKKHTKKNISKPTFFFSNMLPLTHLFIFFIWPYKINKIIESLTYYFFVQGAGVIHGKISWIIGYWKII